MSGSGGLYSGLDVEGVDTAVPDANASQSSRPASSRSFMPAALRRKGKSEPSAPAPAGQKRPRAPSAGDTDVTVSKSPAKASTGSSSNTDLAAAIAASKAAAAAAAAAAVASKPTPPTRAPATPTQPPPTATSTLALPPSIDGEYAPDHPNTYDGVLAAQAAAAAAEAQAQHMQWLEAQRANLKAERQAAYSAALAGMGGGGGAGRGRGSTLPAWASSSTPSKAASPAPGGLSVAASIMARMGYTAGAGLGKHETGMATALEHVKTGKNTGRIVASAPQNTPLPPGQALPGATRVVLVLNSAAPHALPPGHKSAMQQLAGQFGEVLNCVVLELSHEQRKASRTGEAGAVRVFLEFSSETQASAALAALAGRSVGGRELAAEFYDEEKYESMQLLPPGA